MANAFKNVGAALTTSGADIYTAPGSTESVIHAIYVSNVDGTSSADVNIKVTTDGGTTYYHIAKTVPVPADSTLVLDKPVNLEATDKIHMTASANSDLEVFMSVLEIT
tara:strand:+ start:1365 stop:1688 length:324 start_codon:yes stop_codon:yes gene_type:complete